MVHIPIGHPAEQANVPQGLVSFCGIHFPVFAPPWICTWVLLPRLEMQLLFKLSLLICFFPRMACRSLLIECRNL